jgi:hypothetical protein
MVSLGELTRRVRIPRLHGAVSDAQITAIIWLLVFAVHVASPLRTSFDSRWTIHTAVSMVYRGDTDLDEYDDLLRHEEYYAIERRGGHLYNRYPIGASLFALPVVAALALVSGVFPALNPEQLARTGLAPVLEVVVASCVVAATAAVLYLVARLRELPRGSATVLAVIFAFCTSAWSTGSRGLWQHGPSMFLLTSALYLLLLARRRPGLAVVASIPLAFSFVVRPTNAVPIAVFGLYVLIRHSDQFARFATISLTILTLFMAFNSRHYGAFLSPYYLPGGQPMGAWSGAPTAMLGHLVSPNRGLLTFSPFLAFLVPGVVIAIARRELSTLDVAVLAILLIHLVVISLFRQWWAGHSYGPRFFTDVLPFAVYFLIPVLRMITPTRSRAQRMAAFSFALLVAWSFFAHFRAATGWDVWAWNGDPISIDDRPERAWDWNDLQILRGLGD